MAVNEFSFVTAKFLSSLLFNSDPVEFARRVLT